MSAGKVPMENNYEQGLLRCILNLPLVLLPLQFIEILKEKKDESKH